jgi:hypothetical protein
VAILDPDGAVVFTAPSAPFQPPPAAPVQRAARDAPPATPVQRADLGAPPPAPSTAAATAPPAAALVPAQDLDDLARRLYERIRARLRAELRLDLERAGMLTRPGR